MRAAVLAAAADLALILTSPPSAGTPTSAAKIITGVLATAWPFLAGAAASWLVLRVWRAPLAVWPAGVVVWLGRWPSACSCGP